MSDKELKDLIIAELQGNLSILIDTKKKDSFSDQRINTWTKLVSDRLIYHFKDIKN